MPVLIWDRPFLLGPRPLNKQTDWEVTFIMTHKSFSYNYYRSGPRVKLLHRLWILMACSSHQVVLSFHYGNVQHSSPRFLKIRSYHNNLCTLHLEKMLTMKWKTNISFYWIITTLTYGFKLNRSSQYFISCRNYNMVQKWKLSPIWVQRYKGNFAFWRQEKMYHIFQI